MIDEVASYQIVLLGSNDYRRVKILEELYERLKDLGIYPDSLRIFEVGEEQNIKNRLPLMAIYFGSPDHTADTDFVNGLIEESVTIVPIVTALTQVGDENKLNDI